MLVSRSATSFSSCLKIRAPSAGMQPNTGFSLFSKIMCVVAWGCWPSELCVVSQDSELQDSNDAEQPRGVSGRFLANFFVTYSHGHV